MTDRIQAIDTHSDGLRRGEPREAGVNAAIVAAFWMTPRPPVSTYMD